MPTDHLERQFILFGLLIITLLVRLILAGIGLITWSGWIWLTIIALPLAGLAWLINLDQDE